MNISSIGATLLLIGTCLGCAADAPAVDEEPVVEQAEQALTSGGCPLPRPRNRGCSIVCKPCSYAVCEDGRWVYERVDWGDECSGGGGIGGGGGCCKVPVWGGCPAECQCCTYD